MRTETIGEYEIEYSAVLLPEGGDWTAHLAIYGPSTNPMHLSNIFPAQRVATDSVFPSEAEAEAEARRIAIAMIEEGMPRPSHT